MKVTILTLSMCITQWHKLYSHCCTTIPTTHLQNVFIFLDWKPVPIKHSLPIPRALFWVPTILLCLYGFNSSKRCLLLGRKAMTNLDTILKSRDITLPTKVRLVKPLVFPGVMYRYESWTIKKAECWRTDAFELWCWRLSRVPWTVRRSNQSILKEISSEYSLEGLMLKLKLQYFGHLMQRVNSLEKTLMLGKIEGKRRTGQQRMKWLDGITNSMDMNLSMLQEMVKNMEA